MCKTVNCKIQYHAHPLWKAKPIQWSSRIWLNAVEFFIPQFNEMYLRDFDAGPKSTGNRCSLHAVHSNTTSSELLSNEPCFMSCKGLILRDNFLNLCYRPRLLLSMTVILLRFRDKVVTDALIYWGTDERRALSMLIFKAWRLTFHWLHSRTVPNEMKSPIARIWWISLQTCVRYIERSICFNVGLFCIAQCRL